MHRCIRSLSSLGLFVPLAVTACGSDDAVILGGVDQQGSASEEASPALGIATLEYRSALPACGKSNQGQVYYVSSEDQLYFCDSGSYDTLDLELDPSWLTDTIAAKASLCGNGGVVIRSGPDNNENGRLDAKEIKSTSTVCNGKDGKNGVNGRDGSNGATGAAGPAGAAGQNGATGASGAQGSAGIQGPAGSSCTVTDNGNHTRTLSCEDGTHVTIYDGSNGATGPQGPAGGDGQQGETGPQGATGPAGAACSVVASGEHSYDITCPDGSQATIHDGEDGTNATSFPVLLNIVPEPKGGHCHAGGHLVEVGLDVDLSGVLAADEVTGRKYACAPLITIYGNVIVSSDADLEQLRGVVAITQNLWIRGSVTATALGQAATDLERVGSLAIQELDSTSFAFLPLLTVIDLQIANNPTLTSLDLGQVSPTGSVGIYGNGLLTSVGLDHVSSLESLDIAVNPSLTNSSFAQLSSVHYLYIRDNSSLASLGLAALTEVGSDFYVSGNTSFPSCEAQRIYDQLAVNPGYANISSNDDTAVCP